MEVSNYSFNSHAVVAISSWKERKNIHNFNKLLTDNTELRILTLIVELRLTDAPSFSVNFLDFKQN